MLGYISKHMIEFLIVVYIGVGINTFYILPQQPQNTRNIQKSKQVEMYITNNYICYFIFSISILMLIMKDSVEKIKREKIVETKIAKFDVMFKSLQIEKDNLEVNMNSMHDTYDKYIIFSKTNLFGTITEVSSAFCEISGYTKEELIGQPHNIVRHPDMPASAFKDMWDTIQSGEAWNGEVKNHTKSGGFYWVKAIIAPILDSQGVTVGYSSFRVDITKNKLFEYKDEDRRGKDRRDPNNKDRRFNGEDKRVKNNRRHRKTDLDT